MRARPATVFGVGIFFERRQRGKAATNVNPVPKNTDFDHLLCCVRELFWRGAGGVW